MFVIKLKQSRGLLKRCCSSKLVGVVFYETAVAVYPKLKELEKTDRSRFKEPFQKHFIENLFINKFQRTVLEYPEINSLKEYVSIVERSEDAKNLLAAYTLSSPVDLVQSKRAVACIKDLEFCGFKAPVQEGGFGYLNSEFAHFQESLCADMSTLRSISENENFGVDIINHFGTNEQKKKYFKKFLTGETIACFAHSEPNIHPSLDPISTSTKAVLQPDGKTYVISGSKNWVYNANCADVIIFSASVLNSESDTQKVILFIIDKNTDGVTVSETSDTNLKGVHICTVNFNQVNIPSDCILGGVDEGDAIVKSIFSTRELNNSVHCIAIMKKLLNIALSHCINAKFFKKFKYESDYYKMKIGQIASRIYLMESMSYLVAGRIDSFDDADVFLESLILKISSSENMQNVLNETLQIIDRDLLSDIDLKAIINEINFFSASEYSNIYLKHVLGTAGCKHLINYLKNVNPLKKWWETINEFNKLSFTLPKRSELHSGKNHLCGFVHLMFETESLVLQDMVHRLCISSKRLYKKYGQSVLDRKGDLAILADLAVDTYAMVALLGRASRAYCLGVRNQEIDKRIVESESVRLHTQVIEKQLTLYNRSLNSNFENLGANLLNSSVNKKFYPPLTGREGKNQNR